ncbi:MAG TPA: hypothetical protein VIG34_10610 [Xanthobacteraceae bacterium]|jgi:hypothetical protein
MFIGHHAVAFAAKAATPRTSLGTLFLATMWIDLVWPILLLLRIEIVRIAPGDTLFTPLSFVYYPYTHSLLFVVLWAIGFGAVYFALKRDRAAAIIVGLVVLSHWVLDFIVHRPDLPLIPDQFKVGLGLWNFVLATIALELAMFVAGLVLYLRATRAKDRIGTWAFWALIVFLLVIYASVIFGPPPPSMQALAVLGLVAWLMPLWAWRADRHREARG